MSEPTPPPPLLPPSYAPPPPPPHGAYSYPPVQVVQQRGGFGVASCLFGLLLAGSLVLNAVLLVMVVLSGGAAGLSEDGVTEHHVSGEKSATSKIAVIDIHGVIASGGGSMFAPQSDMVEKVLKDLKRVQDDPNVVAVILDVNSPGGGIGDCDRIHNKILEVRKARPAIKFVSMMQDVAASGGYYVSAPCDRILISPTGITGSIGVIMSFMNLQGLYEKIGYREVVIKSGDHKDIGSMGREMTDEERAMLQSILMEMYDRFVKVIVDGRKMEEAKVRKLADGRIYSAIQARENGLVDALGRFEDAVTEAKKLSGATSAEVIRYRAPPTLRDLLSAQHTPTPAEQVFLGPLERLSGRRGGFYYLWTLDGK